MRSMLCILLICLFAITGLLAYHETPASPNSEEIAGCGAGGCGAFGRVREGRGILGVRARVQDRRARRGALRGC